MQVWRARYVLPAFSCWAETTVRQRDLRFALNRCLQVRLNHACVNR